MTTPISLAVRMRMLICTAERSSGLASLDPRSREIVYFVAERQLGGVETAVSQVILNESLGSMGTVQRHLYTLIADRWLEAREVKEDARRKSIILGPLAKDALQAMSEWLNINGRTGMDLPPPGKP